MQNYQIVPKLATKVSKRCLQRDGIVDGIARLGSNDFYNAKRRRIAKGAKEESIARGLSPSHGGPAFGSGA